MGIKRGVEVCGYNLIAKSFLNMNEALVLISRTVKKYDKISIEYSVTILRNN